MKKFLLAASLALAVMGTVSAPSYASLSSCAGGAGTIADPAYDISGNVSNAAACQISSESNDNVGGASSTWTVNTEGFFTTTDWLFSGKPSTGGNTQSGQSGTYNLDALIASVGSSLETVMLVFKDGGGTTIVGYLLNNGTTSGTWASMFDDPPFPISGSGPKDVSHMSIYYTTNPGGPGGFIPIIPIPAALPLMLGGLGLLALLGRRRRQAPV